jgi:hypothetical protein
MFCVELLFMLINSRLISIVGQHLPAVFDVIPRGSGLLKSLSAVALNPQALPPQE